MFKECQMCEFWLRKKEEESGEFGWCLLHPPFLPHGGDPDDNMAYIQPTTYELDWCSKIKRKEENGRTH